eukprot:scaffold2574_cov98-Cylindrotheca_fusiformis.AAC.5
MAPSNQSGGSSSSQGGGGAEPFGQKMSRLANNCMQSTGLCCFKVKEKSQISALEFKITQRQKKFGVDYLTLIENKAPQNELKQCVQQAVADVQKLHTEINNHHNSIDNKEGQVKTKMAPGPSSPKPKSGSTSNTPPRASKSTSSKKPASAKKKKGAASSPKEKTSKSQPSNAASGKAVAANTAEYEGADPSRWKCNEMKFQGSAEYSEKGRQEKVKGPISKEIKKFKANPEKYVALMYQTEMIDWDPKEQECTLLHRAGTVGWKPVGVTPKGWMTVLFQTYERCKPFPKDEFPKEFRDKYTDSMVFQGRKIHSKSLKPVMPGRGMGCGDAPNLKIIGDVDPADIYQGSVGDCWLLSGISALAEFDGAVKKLFRKTKNLMNMPTDKPNQYIVTLWDLKTWKEVDIMIDERLCANPDGKQMLLGAKPSEDGELWAPYLEKAVAAHCGGFDRIVGGQCTHGCKEQYTIHETKETGLYGCYGKFNNYESKWAVHGNSPHDTDQNVYKMPWPKVGGGGEEDISKDELFLKMVAWDKINYIVGAGTKGDSDKNSTGGLVDNHAYSVIESIHNVAGTGIDLIKVRNPWGKGEIEDGEFDDDGPGWDKYPKIKALLNPVVADDGIFWVTKDEFFDFFQTIYLSASNMTEYVEDTNHKH